MHQLQDDTATALMHRVGHLPPAGNLCSCVDGRGAAVTQAVGRRRSTFGNDQSGTGALAIVVDHLGPWQRLGTGTAAGHWRHDNTVGQLQFTQAQRLEQDTHLSSFTSWKFPTATQSRSGSAARAAWLPTWPLSAGLHVQDHQVIDD
ncbi:hypothetical protein D3C77_447930 [compost metagenome]